ncbi:hypothetical protein ACFO3J_24150 [Streptomyces polygonati]|uniref:Uncharacterized protein n=1 Tax=Streptomyces polygonati TaxID=1617087 RepID=A0ABV8HWF5_9ACTN
MTLDPLATLADAERFGYTLPPGEADSLLDRASVRVRRAAGQPITPSVVSIEISPDSRRVQLPAPPVIEVQSVAEVAEDGSTTPLTGWRWDGTVLRLPHHHGHRWDLLVTYRRGWDPVPDGAIELVCQVAHRLGNTPLGMDVGIRSQSQQIDDYQTSTTFAAEQVQVAGDLLPGELTALKRALGAVPAVWVVSTSE